MKNKFFLLAITFCLPIHSQGVSKSFIPMAEIPAGSFYMGSDGLGEDFDEAPIHQVIISRPFRMGITPSGTSGITRKKRCFAGR